MSLGEWLSIATQPWPPRFLTVTLLGNALTYFYSLAAPSVRVSQSQISFLSRDPALELCRLSLWGEAGETSIGTLGVPSSLLPLSLTLFGAEIGLSLFCSYREIHSLALVGLPVAGIAPAL